MNDLILFDSHVHVYDCFDVHRFLNAAYDNFEAVAKARFDGRGFGGLLLMSETSKDHWFEKCATEKTVSRGGDGAPWRFEPTAEPHALRVRSNGRILYLIAGRQVVTAEDLEVLALFSRNTYADGQPIEAVLDEVLERGGVPVIPWGTGKWLGRRGEILNRLLESRFHDFLLGDNGGRPVFWTRPGHFKKAKAKGVRILPGSDPLPFPEEAARVASFGAACEAHMDAERPARALKTLIRKPDTVFVPYGHLESPLRFLKNQIAMQIVKRRRTRIARGR